MDMEGAFRAVPNWLERGRESRPAQLENGEESAHDGGGSGDQNSGHDAGLPIGVAFGNGVGTDPYLDDAPNESKHEDDPKG